jgi:hypothetical protein
MKSIRGGEATAGMRGQTAVNRCSVGGGRAREEDISMVFDLTELLMHNGHLILGK